MPRFRLLLVALAIAAMGYWYLTRSATLARERVQTAAEERLVAGQPAIAQHAAQSNAAAIATARLVAGNEAIGQAMDEHGRPNAEALEVALGALQKAQPLEAERPALLVLLGGGAAGRYRLGQSNRFDADQTAFVALGEVGPAHTSTGTIEGQSYRLAIVSFDNPKAEGRGLLGLGYPLDDAYAKNLALGSGLDVILLSGGKVVGASLSPIERGDMSPQGLPHKESFGFGYLSGDRFVLTDLVPPLARYLKLPIGTQGARYQGRALGLLALGQPAGSKIQEKVAPGEGTVEVVLAAKTLDEFGLLADEQKVFLVGFALLMLLTLILLATAGNPIKGLDRVVAASEKMALGDEGVRAPTDHMSRLSRRTAIALNTLVARLEAVPPAALPPTASRTVSQELAGAQPPRPPDNAAETSPSAGSPADARSVDAFLAGRAADNDPFGTPTEKPPAPPAMQAWGEADRRPNYDQTVIAPMPEALIRATSKQPSQPSSMSSPTEPAPVRTGSPTPPPTIGDEAHYQQIYREFVATRERCGEAADGLTFEKFAAKLKKNQEQLITKYSCRSVRFQVYVKDGKAALKATPVR
jgi:hypothetical protein